MVGDHQEGIAMTEPLFRTKDAQGNDVLWWPEKGLTTWALRDPPLQGVRGWRVKTPDGKEQYVVTEGQTPVYETREYEAAACYIDAMRLDRDL